ncbi:MAG: UvrD-helicase domain-containing protein [Helicobacteraceae bacterium]|nr:UvrD-helicase domain-containing protein [Helicobacteraceae bacterium]
MAVKSLTSEQQAVARIDSGRHLVLAPPGCGKTELLSIRAQTALENGVCDRDMICLTFTIRAAKNMRDRIEILRPNSAITICNIHSYCFSFLSRNKLIAWNTEILDEEDSSQLIDDIKGNSSIKNDEIYDCASYLQKINFGIETPYISYMDEVKNIAEKYIREKQKFRFIDFDDILNMAYYHLCVKGGDFEIGEFKWIQIDEAQDLNPMQHSIIDRICAEEAAIVYFADFQQAIFSFMGAKLESLLDIEEKCGKNIHRLTRNFRSPSYLLDIYNEYMQTWIKSAIKDMKYIANINQKPSKEDLAIYETKGNFHDNVKYIAKNIISKLDKLGGNTAILVRANKYADEIDEVFNRLKIEHFKVSGFDLFRRAAIKGVLAFLFILKNPFDKSAWARLYRDFGATKTIKEAREHIYNLEEIALNPIDFLICDQNRSRIIDFLEIYENKRIIIFDTETTGLDTDNDDIIQIAAIEIINGVMQKDFEVYIKTDRDLEKSEKVHKISKEKLEKDGVDRKTALKLFIDFLGGDFILAAHNLNYDLAILKSNLKRYSDYDLIINNPTIDSLELSRLLYHNLYSHKLGDLIAELKLKEVNFHNAKDDAIAANELLKQLYIDSKVIAQEQINYFTSPQSKADQKFRKFFKDIFGEANLILPAENAIAKLYDLYFEIFGIDETKPEEITAIKTLKKHIDRNQNTSFEDQILFYRSARESDLYSPDEKIFISTVHKAKGLEFENVVIAGANEDIFPFYWAKISENSAEQISEEARIFFVAITRAKKRLLITYHTSDLDRYGREHERIPSRFLRGISRFFTTYNSAQKLN